MVQLPPTNPDAQRPERRLPVVSHKLVEEGLSHIEIEPSRAEQLEGRVQWNARGALAQEHAIQPVTPLPVHVGITVGVPNVRRPVVAQEQVGVGDAAEMDLRVFGS